MFHALIFKCQTIYYCSFSIQSGILFGPKLSMDDVFSVTLAVQCEFQTHSVVSESYISWKSIQHLFLLPFGLDICHVYVFFHFNWYTRELTI